MARIEFVEVKTDEQQHALADMAAQIWNEYWPPIIGQDQTTYMVEKFQSLEAIKRDMAENGYEYWFIVRTEDNSGPQVTGFTGGHVELETNRFFISKIYLYAENRGQGLCSDAIRFYDDLCHARGLEAMYLTVNKHNELGIRAYKAKGFETIDAVETDIGNGFIMDDYIMEKRV